MRFSRDNDKDNHTTGYILVKGAAKIHQLI